MQGLKQRKDNNTNKEQKTATQIAKQET